MYMYAHLASPNVITISLENFVTISSSNFKLLTDVVYSFKSSTKSEWLTITDSLGLLSSLYPGASFSKKDSGFIDRMNNRTLKLSP